MKIYIVTHKHDSESFELCYNDIVSAHISREKAEESVEKEKLSCLNEYWQGYESQDGVEIDRDLAGLFEIHDNYSCNGDEILIHEQIIKD